MAAWWAVAGAMQIGTALWSANEAGDSVRDEEKEQKLQSILAEAQGNYDMTQRTRDLNEALGGNMASLAATDLGIGESFKAMTAREIEIAGQDIQAIAMGVDIQQGALRRQGKAAKRRGEDARTAALLRAGAYTIGTYADYRTYRTSPSPPPPGQTQGGSGLNRGHS